MSYQTMKFEDILKWCKENKQTKWLKEKMFTEEGEEKKVNYLALKREFCKKFMPEIIPTAKPKKPTMFDLMAEL